MNAVSERIYITLKEKATADFFSELFPTVLEGDADGFSDVSLVVWKKDINASTERVETDDEKSEEQSKVENACRKFACHRFVLASRSSVFNRTFAGGKWKEDKGVVEIVDIDEKTMENVFRYIYLGQFPNSETIKMEQVSNVVYAADKYDLAQLTNWRVSLTIYKLLCSDAVNAFELADRHGVEQLKAVCLSILSMDSGDFLQKSRG